MVNTEYLKIPKDRVGVAIGKNGKIKHQLEIITKTELKIDSDTGDIAISSTDETDDPLAIWKARYMIKAIGRGFNPDIALTLEDDEMILEIINLQDYVGKSKKALVRQKGRIIGKNGRTRQIMHDMLDVEISIYGKTVSLIGKIENIQMAREAIEMILDGSRQKTVYAYLEKMHDKLKRQEFDELVNGKPDRKDILREDLDTDENFTDAEKDYNKDAISEEDEDEDEFEEVPETL
ncbi:MAG: RNA-processing protein [Methanosphaera sp. SHI1033]|jgi:ribosomal RNA assembly protein|nr:MAG: RNA-processing protein [Methanosphaera sp. SHI1033]